LTAQITEATKATNAVNINVPLLDLTRYDDDVMEEFRAAFERVLRSGHYILGQEVEAFEQECAEYIGVKHAIGVSSGTDALLLALMTLGIGTGDEVICPTYTFFATAGSIWRMGAKPVFVDSNPVCYNLDPAQIEGKLTKRTKAIMPVHLYGQCAEMDEIMEISRRHGFPVIEDAAQAIGAEYKNRGAGTMGAFGCFSFFPSKNLGALGDAGLLTTNDDELAAKARILRVHGAEPKYYHKLVGANFRIDALQAALLRVKLRRLNDYTAKRQSNAALYTKLLMASGLAAFNADTNTCAAHCASSTNGADAASLSAAALLLPVACQSKHIYNQYIVRVKGAGRRDELRSFLKNKNVATEIYYPVPSHLQECFAALDHAPGDFPVAEAAAAETLALPIFPELTTGEIHYVVEQIAAFFQKPLPLHSI
jgi:dTDP-4-amino-4,6-dideoxygalactose transaminase